MNRLQRFQKTFEDDPKFQIKFNKVSTYAWLIQMAVLPIVFYGISNVWAKYAVFYLTEISLFANFATSYGAVSASESSEAAKEAAEHATVIRNDHPEITSVGD